MAGSFLLSHDSHGFPPLPVSIVFRASHTVDNHHSNHDSANAAPFQSISTWHPDDDLILDEQLGPRTNHHPASSPRNNGLEDGDEVLRSRHRSDTGEDSSNLPPFEVIAATWIWLGGNNQTAAPS